MQIFVNNNIVKYMREIANYKLMGEYAWLQQLRAQIDG